MRALPFALLLVFSVVAHGEGEKVLDDIATLRWENRLIVVDEPRQRDVVIAQLQDDAGAIDDRRIVWFVLSGGGLRSNYPGELSAELAGNIRSRVRAGESVALIGLDGGVKLRLPSLDLPAIYAAVDAMPMRRRER